MSFWGYALRPFRHFADFHGRSTRTELFIFWFASGPICAIADSAGGFAGLPLRMGYYLAGLILLCPSLALCIRRLHDSGRRGWWLLLALPEAALSLRDAYLLWWDPSAFAHAELPFYVGVAAFLPAVALFILLITDDQESPNAWGPNPRYPDDVALPEHAGEPA